MQQDFSRIYSPPDRELEWTDEGIQSSKNLVNKFIDIFLKKN